MYILMWPYRTNDVCISMPVRLQWLLFISLKYMSVCLSVSSVYLAKNVCGLVCWLYGLPNFDFSSSPTCLFHRLFCIAEIRWWVCVWWCFFSYISVFFVQTGVHLKKEIKGEASEAPPAADECIILSEVNYEQSLEEYYFFLWLFLFKTKSD